MKTYQLKLIREQWQGLPRGHHAIYVIDGTLTVGNTTSVAGESLYIENACSDTLSDSDATILRFSLEADDTPSPATGFVMSSPITILDTTALMRLDQVTFPPGAVAYRHTLPGPGIRYLLRAELELAADDHTKTVGPGDAWFEDADSPVRATASKHIETAFIRCMILPATFEG